MADQLDGCDTSELIVSYDLLQDSANQTAKKNHMIIIPTMMMGTMMMKRMTRTVDYHL
jgi:hypothetical protein